MFDWIERVWIGFWKLWLKALIYVFLFTFALTSAVATWRHFFN